MPENDYSPLTSLFVILLVVLQTQQYDIAVAVSNVKKNATILYDELGVPIVDYGQVGDTFIGTQRNPITISTTATDAYSRYRSSGNQTERAIVINNANWLVSNAHIRYGYALLNYEFPWPTYNLHPPWQSGMAQGLALKALIAAHALTGEGKYLEAAKLLLNSFFVEVLDGGVTYKDSNGGWWYEEYAKIDGKSPRVLNGMMYTLLAIYDYFIYTNDSSAKYLFDKGLLALITNLPKYDDPLYSYSYYDALHTTNSLFYHNVHIYLLDKLYKISGIDTLKAFHDRWQKFSTPPFLQ